MNKIGRRFFLPAVACVVICGRMLLAEEKVFRINVQNRPALAAAGNLFPLDPNGDYPKYCFLNAREFDSAACAKVFANVDNSFTVYRKDEIDSKTDAINSQLNDLGTKVDSLNKKIASDEASLPAVVDQYAVQKLEEKINALEARVKTLESHVGVHQQ
jgi:hypothetical protein